MVQSTRFLTRTVRTRPYDFRDAENTDCISEYSYKNGIYSLTQNVMEYKKLTWINQNYVITLKSDSHMD